MMPVVDGLEAEFEGLVPVLRLNADEDGNAQLLADYGLRGHPSFVVLDKNSQVIGRYFGPQTDETLRGALSVIATSD